MAIIFDRASYNSLPCLEEANISYQALQADKIINGPIRDIFLKHNANTTFGLYLKYRYHRVRADETVVKVEGCTVLLDNRIVQDLVSVESKVVATTWTVSDGKLLPMEFALVPAAIVSPTPTPAFVSDLVSILALNGCGDLFGIATITSKPWVEMTIDRTRVLIPCKEDDYDREKFIPVAFAFHREWPEFKVHGRCKKNHEHTTKP